MRGSEGECEGSPLRGARGITITVRVGVRVNIRIRVRVGVGVRVRVGFRLGLGLIVEVRWHSGIVLAGGTSFCWSKVRLLVGADCAKALSLVSFASHLELLH